jgi:hypothetical protein
MSDMLQSLAADPSSVHRPSWSSLRPSPDHRNASLDDSTDSLLEEARRLIQAHAPALAGFSGPASTPPPPAKPAPAARVTASVLPPAGGSAFVAAPPVGIVPSVASAAPAPAPVDAVAPSLPAAVIEPVQLRESLLLNKAPPPPPPVTVPGHRRGMSGHSGDGLVGPSSVITMDTTKSRSTHMGSLMRPVTEDVLPLGRGTTSASSSSSNPKSGRTFDSVLASYPKNMQFAIREMILDVMEIEMRKEALEERFESVRALHAVVPCAIRPECGCVVRRLRLEQSRRFWQTFGGSLPTGTAACCGCVVKTTFLY